MGAADCLALAANCHTLVLEGVPRLTTDNPDTARRFMTLVDVLYDQGARLVCAAEAITPHGHDDAPTPPRLIRVVRTLHLAEAHFKSLSARFTWRCQAGPSDLFAEGPVRPDRASSRATERIE